MSAPKENAVPQVLVEPNSPTPSVSKSPLNIWFVILGAILILLLGVGTFYFFGVNNQAAHKTTNPSPTSFPYDYWKNITISELAPIKDEQSELLYVQNGKVFSQKFDGSAAKELKINEEPVVDISLTPDRESMLFETKKDGTSSAWIKKNDQVQKLVLTNHNIKENPITTVMESNRPQFGEIYTLPT